MPNTLTLPLTGHANRLPTCFPTLCNHCCFKPFGALADGSPIGLWAHVLDATENLAEVIGIGKTTGVGDLL